MSRRSLLAQADALRTKTGGEGGIAAARGRALPFGADRSQPVAPAAPREPCGFSSRLAERAGLLRPADGPCPSGLTGSQPVAPAAPREPCGFSSRLAANLDVRTNYSRSRIRPGYRPVQVNPSLPIRGWNRLFSGGEL